ncbi:oxidoreductase [Penicillium brasilianum]|uniref:D-xylose 1-dehydrogenase (NADP(+), D-xylono-1,5-lactone-forming) n=1 Tax=Penicillium brasilianum TaxID=104259 RepID=A0A1S9RGT8_PENBI|nr:oxidoreductase [Penicillium brasilianum]
MSFIQLLQRSYKAIFNPPDRGSKENAVRFGLLGASTIAPIALIGPAKSHPEAIVVAVAARDRGRAEEYAKKHQIPIIHDSYQDLLNDQSIDAVYIALPNGWHYEWALRCLQAGKHVLLEKPATSNAIDAEKLFQHPLATAVNAPIIQEAFHYQFHPAWQAFLSEVRRAGSLKAVHCMQTIPRGALAPDDIRFQFELGGGCLMDVGTYALSAVRQVLNRVPVEVVDATYRLLENTKEGELLEGQVDQYIAASLRTRDGKIATITADISSSFEWPSFLPKAWRLNIPSPTMPMCQAILEEVSVDALPEYDDAEHLIQRTVTIWNYIVPVVWHRIDISERHRIVKEGRDVKVWKDTRYLKAYNWLENEELAEAYEDWWTTWRCQLEEFIHLVKGRRGSGVRVDAQESIAQMAVIDDIYRKTGLKPRPSSSYKLPCT